MARRLLALLYFAFFPVLFSACSTLPLDGKLPDGLVAERISTIDGDSPFALSPDGSVVAMVKDGLQLLHLSYKESIPLGDRTPLKLAWSPLGYSLAAVYAKGEGSSIAVYDQHGIPVAESAVKTRLTDLVWLSEDELVAGGVKISNYKFGSNYLSSYFRWKPWHGVPSEVSLRDTTLKNATYARWKKELERGPMLDLAAQSGTLLFLQPIDPPLFNPYYKVIMKDLASGKELEIASVSLNSGGARFSADGEKILYSDGNGTTLLHNPWTAETFDKTETAGENLSISPEGEQWFADGTLFGKERAALPMVAGGAARFSGDGSKMVVRAGGALYLISGLKRAEGTLFVPVIAEKIAKLRSMRIQELITPQEYKENLKRVTAP